MPGAGKLVPTTGNKTGKGEVALGQGRVTIGRSTGNTVVLDDREVSKMHAEIVTEPEGFVVHDLGSSNGTFVNGKKVERHKLSAGDIVEMGGSRYLFTTGADAAVAIL